MTIVEEELSERAKALLRFLNLHRGNLYSCVAFLPGCAKPYLVIPKPTFNWDTKERVLSVKHPKAFKELVCLDYVELKEFSTKSRRVNQVYVLTEVGRRKGIDLIQSSPN